MKKLLLFLLMASSAMAKTNDPVNQAVVFNNWYVNQINNNNFPITDGKDIDKYVTASTMQKLRRTQDPNYDDEVFYDADFFLKAQDIGEDWPGNVSAIAGDTDPVCVNVYVAFGKEQKHIVIDCMVKESGFWKVQSVTSLQFIRNLERH
ncbi:MULTISPECIES: DUF3828 domain-containing protein [Citrobacter freundii complex]|uniref:DUF3828 domain-containing protein n=1 Tax=Citrobacter freundii complex TaxID=1344959 RepID=UPI0018A48BAF|nr:DUF3828 domain-containing protein [Citrobacter cronae]MBJ8363964.1 DUF3828 domain-containing protein [Citrobacter cronae]BBV31117.1 hypothetical protein STW0522CIT01_26060 [Citrobacter freundii]BBV36130.1 hypothetical protein STW0522CIT19_26050 [Citrobacter freundii]